MFVLVLDLIRVLDLVLVLVLVYGCVFMCVLVFVLVVLVRVCVCAGLTCVMAFVAACMLEFAFIFVCCPRVCV